MTVIIQYLCNLCKNEIIPYSGVSVEFTNIDSNKKRIARFSDLNERLSTHLCESCIKTIPDAAQHFWQGKNDE